ncbi:MAG: hypothetical protein ACOYO7_03340 [Phycisphaerales bacterium]
MRTARFVLALPAGLVIMMATIAAVESLGLRAFPPGETMAAAVELAKTDVEAGRDAMRDALPTVPMGAFASVLAAWMLGGAAGAFLAGSIAARAHLALGVAVAALLLLACVTNLVLIPHPAWMWPAGVVLPAGTAVAVAALTRPRGAAALR